MVFGNVRIVSEERIEDTNPDLYIRRAEDSIRKGNLNQAIAECDKAILFSNQKAHYIFEKAKILNQSGRFEECYDLIRSNLSKFSKGLSESSYSLSLFYFHYSYFKRKVPPGLSLKMSNIAGGRVARSGNQGVIIYKNTHLYIGDIVENRRSGTGTYIWPIGDCYHGDWNDQLRDGKGTYIWRAEESFTGQWKEGKRHGPGVFESATGERHHAEWIDGLLKKPGNRVIMRVVLPVHEETDPNYYLQRSLRLSKSGKDFQAIQSIDKAISLNKNHDEKYILAKIRILNRAKSMSVCIQLIDQQFSRLGGRNGSHLFDLYMLKHLSLNGITADFNRKTKELKLENGRYVGAIANNVPHGRGVFISAHGDAYAGEWENGLRHGRGTFFWSDQSFHSGKWSSDELNICEWVGLNSKGTLPITMKKMNESEQVSKWLFSIIQDVSRMLALKNYSGVENIVGRFTSTVRDHKALSQFMIDKDAMGWFGLEKPISLGVAVSLLGFGIQSFEVEEEYWKKGNQQQALEKYKAIFRKQRHGIDYSFSLGNLPVPSFRDVLVRLTAFHEHKNEEAYIAIKKWLGVYVPRMEKEEDKNKYVTATTDFTFDLGHLYDKKNCLPGEKVTWETMHLLSGYQEFLRKRGKQDVSSSVLYNKHILYQTIRALLKEQGISGTNSFYLFAMMRSLKGRCWELYEKHQGIKWSARLLPVALILFIAFNAYLLVTSAKLWPPILDRYYFEKIDKVIGSGSVADAALKKAIQSRDLERIYYLVSQGANPNVVGDNGETPLTLAIQMNDFEIVRFLLENGANPNGVEGARIFPIEAAIGNDLQEIVQLLLDHGADPNKGLPLFAAIENGNQELVLLLLKYEADPNIEDTSANLPLMLAIKTEQEDTIEALITAGARLNLLGDSELNALIFTSDQEYSPENSEIFQLILSKTSNKAFQDSMVESLLWWAFDHQEQDILEAMLSKGASADIARDGNAMIMEAVNLGDVQTLALLLKYHADPNGTDQDGITMLMHAANRGNSDMLHALLEKGADIQTVNELGQTVLYYAQFNVAIWEALLEKGAGNNSDFTPLLLEAIGSEKTEILAAAIEYIKDLDGILESGDALLIEAARAENVKMVRILLEAGADPNIENHNEETALVIALNNEGEEVVALLEEYGALSLGALRMNKLVGYWFNHNQEVPAKIITRDDYWVIQEYHKEGVSEDIVEDAYYISIYDENNIRYYNKEFKRISEDEYQKHITAIENEKKAEQQLSDRKAAYIKELTGYWERTDESDGNWYWTHYIKIEKESEESHRAYLISNGSSGSFEIVQKNVEFEGDRMIVNYGLYEIELSKDKRSMMLFNGGDPANYKKVNLDQVPEEYRK